ncbi:MAG: hypothetical protein ABJE66_03040 [Deltaproteobacteria bacterium]
MKLLALALACAAFGATAHAEPFAATATSGPETWKKYDVRGIELGMSRKDLVKKGFKCGKRANSRCYKLMDKRCDKGRCELEEDAFGQWFELDGAKTQLDYMTCATTETDEALVYDIRLEFGPRQPLAEDSTLGKALFAKYGPATEADEVPSSDKVGGGRMLWWNKDVGNNGPNIVVDCNGTNSEGPQCSLEVEDYGIQSVERSKQAERDNRKKRDNGPKTAPEL